RNQSRSVRPPLDQAVDPRNERNHPENRHSTCVSSPSGNLLESALMGRLVRPPAQKLGAMTKSFCRHLVNANFDDEFRTQRFPRSAPLRAPAAGAARSVAGETRRLAQFLQTIRQSGSV